MLNAVALSLAIHFLLVVAIEAGNKAGFWRFSAVAALSEGLMEEVRRTDEELKKAKEEAQRQAEEEAAMIFVDIDPAEADPRDEPKETPFYSTATTAAANPKTTLDETKPGFDGKQTEILKTRDSTAAKPAQPAPKPELETEMRPEPLRPQIQPEPQPEPPTETPPEPPPPPAPKPEPDGVVQVAKVRPNDNPFSDLMKPRVNDARPQPPPPTPPRQRPRTLDEARAQKGILDGRQMRQEGGVRRFSIQSSMDVRATPFGAYDAAFIAAVQARWYALLDEHGPTQGQSGKVVLDFRLTEDGRITNMRVAALEVTETLGWLCQRAVLDPAPYAAFPSDLRRMLRNDYRDVRFTFLYSY